MQHSKSSTEIVPIGSATAEHHADPLAPFLPAVTMETWPEENQPDAQGPLKELWEIVSRSRILVTAVGIVGLAAGFFYDASQPPLFRSTATIEIQPQGDSIIEGRGQEPGSADVDTLDTQVAILESRTLRAKAYETVKAKSRRVVADPSPLSRWLSKMGLAKLFPNRVASFDQVLTVTNAHVKASIQNRTRIVGISVDSPDPTVAADFANTLVDEYIGQNADSRWTSMHRNNDWLSKQLDELRLKLEASDRELQDYAKRTGLMFTSGRETIAEDRLKEIQLQLSAAQGLRIDKELRYQLASGSMPGVSADILTDDAIRAYEVQLNDLKRQEAELSYQFTPAYYKVQRIHVQVGELENTIANHQAALRARVEGEFKEAVARQQVLTSNYETQAALISKQDEMAVHYNVLKREVDANRQIYETILQKAKELGITAALRVSNVRVIDTALPPNEAVAVRWLQNPLLGLLTALGLCVAGLLFKSRVDPNLRTPGDGIAYLNVRELGVIPSAAYGPEINSLRSIWKKQTSLLLGAVEGETNGAVERATHEQKPSLLAESFRSTFASVLFSLKPHQTSVLTITSPGAGTGKSTCSSNLAIAIAETKRRVILIDADMRKPRQHMIFDVPNTWGLSDLLHSTIAVDQLPLAALIRPTGIPNLRVMPSGPSISTAPSQLFTTRLPEILKRLRKDCDVIVIDTPPMLQFPDARAIARHSEGVVLVMRSGKSRRDDAKAAIQRLMADGSSILGTILNDWNPVESGHSYYNRYYSET